MAWNSVKRDKKRLIMFQKITVEMIVLRLGTANDFRHITCVTSLNRTDRAFQRAPIPYRLFGRDQIRNQVGKWVSPFFAGNPGLDLGVCAFEVKTLLSRERARKSTRRDCDPFAKKIVHIYPVVPEKTRARSATKTVLRGRRTPLKMFWLEHQDWGVSLYTDIV